MRILTDVDNANRLWKKSGEKGEERWEEEPGTTIFKNVLDACRDTGAVMMNKKAEREKYSFFLFSQVLRPQALL